MKAEGLIYTLLIRNIIGKRGRDLMRNFIAFDFETANRYRHSICSAGMIIVEDGKVIDSIYQLINPEEPFDDYNIAIHGINPRDVKSSPTFNEFYENIRGTIQDKLMVAHNLSFDGYALRDNLLRYKIQPAFNRLLCTYQLSKKLLVGQSSYSIKSLCQYYGINLENHHNALDDAKACAELMLKLSSNYQLLDFDSVFLKTGIKPGEISEQLISKGIFITSNIGDKKNRFSSLKIPDIKVNRDADKENPFFNKNVVFTGKLNLFSRKEAAEIVADKGGYPQNNITKDTDYIVLGNFDDSMIKGNKSSKLERAEKMISEGSTLEIISEEDFLQLMSDPQIESGEEMINEGNTLEGISEDDLLKLMSNIQYIPPKGEFITFQSDEHLIEKLSIWGFNKSVREEVRYKQDNFQLPVKIKGYEEYGTNNDFNTVIIEFSNGNLSCINPAYLKEMQSPSFRKNQSTEIVLALDVEFDDNQLAADVKERIKNKNVAKAEKAITLPTEKVHFAAKIKEFSTNYNHFKEEYEDIIIFEEVNIESDNKINLGLAWCSYSKTLKKLGLTEGKKINFDGKVVKKKFKKEIMYKINNPSKVIQYKNQV